MDYNTRTLSANILEPMGASNNGHTFASFAGLVMLGLLAPKIKWFTWSLAILIGASRVFYGAHGPTDVILGAFIGMVAADLVKAALKSKSTDFFR